MVPKKQRSAASIATRYRATAAWQKDARNVEKMREYTRKSYNNRIAMENTYQRAFKTTFSHGADLLWALTATWTFTDNVKRMHALDAAMRAEATRRTFYREGLARAGQMKELSKRLLVRADLIRCAAPVIGAVAEEPSVLAAMEARYLYRPDGIERLRRGPKAPETPVADVQPRERPSGCDVAPQPAHIISNVLARPCLATPDTLPSPLDVTEPVDLLIAPERTGSKASLADAHVSRHDSYPFAFRAMRSPAASSETDPITPACDVDDDCF